jgi:hypothetical protein
VSVVEAARTLGRRDDDLDLSIAGYGKKFSGILSLSPSHNTDCAVLVHELDVDEALNCIQEKLRARVWNKLNRLRTGYVGRKKKKKRKKKM